MKKLKNIKNYNENLLVFLKIKFKKEKCIKTGKYYKAKMFNKKSFPIKNRKE